MSKKILIVGAGNVGLHAAQKIKALGLDASIVIPDKIPEALETESHLPTTNNLLSEEKIKTYKITDRYKFADNKPLTRADRRAAKRRKKNKR